MTVNQEFYIEQISLQNEREIKTCSDKQKLEEFAAIRPFLQDILKLETSIPTSH